MSKFKVFVFVLLAFVGVAHGQKTQNYVKGRAIVKFKDGVLSKPALTKKDYRLDFETAFVKSSVKEKIKRSNALHLRKLIRNSHPDIRTSISRNGEVISIPDFHNIVYLTLHDSVDIEKFCAKMRMQDEVEFAEPDYLFVMDEMPPVPSNNDAYFPSQLFLDNPITFADINAKRAWDFTRGSSAVRVAVIDSGIDYTNPDLGGSFGHGFHLIQQVCQ